MVGVAQKSYSTGDLHSSRRDHGVTQPNNTETRLSAEAEEGVSYMHELRVITTEQVLRQLSLRLRKITHDRTSST